MNECINEHEKPWINNDIKHNIRKRRRSYRKAKLTNSQIHWNKFRRLRIDAVLSIKLVKARHLDSLSNKLKNVQTVV